LPILVRTEASEVIARRAQPHVIARKAA
jgi:hypothetical protein